MRSLVEIGFQTAGSLERPTAQEPGCLTDIQLADYMANGLSATERRHLEDHALDCSGCLLLVRSVVDVREAARVAPARVSIVARLLQKGLELLNPLEITLRNLAGEPAPALGALRRETNSGQHELISIEGPGRGLDEVQLQLQPNGQVRLSVRSDSPLPLQPGEVSSILLKVDGAPREKRPYSGAPLSFAPQSHGRFHLTLIARAPGQDVRELCEVLVDLRD
jgi:hypothetical protein